MSEPATGLAQARKAEGGRRQGIVDVDVHPLPSSVDEIRGRMPRSFCDRYQGERRSFFNNPVRGFTARRRAPGRRTEGVRSRFPSYEYGVAYAILVSRTFCNIHPDPDYAAAIATAFNETLPRMTWLSAFSRLYRSPLPGRLKTIRAFPKPFEAYRFWEAYLPGFSRRDAPQTAEDVDPAGAELVRRATVWVLRYQGREWLLVKVIGWSRIA